MLLPEIYGIAIHFVGCEDDHRYDLFNVLDFRLHLNRYFKCGTSGLKDAAYVHWIFKRDDGVRFDSVQRREQDVHVDLHCTLYSLYYEVLNSSYEGVYLNGARLVRLQPLSGEARRRAIYKNLSVVYRMLWNLFTDQRFLRHCMDFKPWCKFEGWVYNTQYADLAEEAALICSRAYNVG